MSCLLAVLFFALLALPLMAAPPDVNLRVLPENPRYFQYKGLPVVLFWGTHHWGWNRNPNQEELDYSASYANFITIQATNFRSGEKSNYPNYWARISDDAYWEKIRQSVQWAHERDLIVYVYHYDGYGLGRYHKMEWLIRNPDSDLIRRDLAEFGLPGKTSMDVHEKVIQQTVKHLWDCPNVVYDMCFEIMGSIRHGRVDHTLTRWWNQRLREVGKAHNPAIEHLVTTMYGGDVRDDYGPHCQTMHPSEWSGDFILGQSCSEGFRDEPDLLPQQTLDYNVPLVRMGLQHLFIDHGDFMHITLDDYNTHPNYQRLRRQLVKGIHSAEPYGGKSWKDVSSELARDWYLRLRFYMENIETWQDEPGDEISQARLPHPVAPTARPTAENPAGYVNGHRLTDAGLSFACIYRHPDGLAPSRVEVWVDRNGDGRYDPDYQAGERIRLQASGDNYRQGVLFTAGGIRPTSKDASVSYIFRVGDANWYPASPGGVIPTNNPGISYSSWSAPLGR